MTGVATVIGIGETGNKDPKDRKPFALIGLGKFDSDKGFNACSVSTGSYFPENHEMIDKIQLFMMVEVEYSVQSTGRLYISKMRKYIESEEF